MSLSKEICKIFNYESWVHAVSGATGSVVAMSVFYPLDTVRARIQVEDPSINKVTGTYSALYHISKEEGILSLYKGIVPVLESVCISNFVYFYTFHSLKAIYGNGQKQQSAVKDLLLGSIAGIFNVMLTTPFWVVNTRLKMKGIIGANQNSNKNFNNLLNGLLYIAKSEGITGLWAGAIPSLLLVINPALQFMLYETLKRKLMNINGSVHSFTYFILGALSKAFATLLTYPLQLIQTKLRIGDKSLPKNIGALHMLFRIAKLYGFKDLYRGLETKIWQTVLTAALMFATYEKIALLVGKTLLGNEVKAKK